MANMNLFVRDLNGSEHRLQAEADQSVMEVVKAAGVVNLRAECGGLCSCATCHIYVDEQWIGRLPDPADFELAMLDLAENRNEERSRLSCQIILDPSLDGLIIYEAPQD